MATKILYCDETLNVTVGCTKVGPGCDNCWAERLHTMRHKAYLAGKKMPKQYAKPFSEIQLFPERIEQPRRCRKSCTIFVNSMSDLFHPSVPFEIQCKVFETIANVSQHKYLILTKRVREMLNFFQACEDYDSTEWPNVYLGVTICNPSELWKITELCRIWAAYRWISFEPLLEDVGDISPYLTSCSEDDTDLDEFGQHIDWVVIGCEKLAGNKAGRFCEDEERFYAAVRSIVEQCRDAGTKVYVKQLPLNGKVVTDINKFLPDLRIQETI